MLRLVDLLKNGETIAKFGLTGEYCQREAITKTDSDDISAALEMTLHRILDAGGTEKDVHRIMGAYIPTEEEVAELEEYNEFVWLDLGYVLPGLIDFWEEKKFVTGELKEYLEAQDVWEREAEELLGKFDNNVTKDDLHVVAIFDSAYDLGENYVDNVVGELDHHVKAVLDYAELGEHLADSCEEYFLLSSGRIIEFEL